MRKVKNIISKIHLRTPYNSLVYPYIDYGITLWGTTHATYVKHIAIMQKKAIRIATGANYNDHTEPLFKQMKLLKLKDVHKIKVATFMFSASKGILPSPLICMITNTSEIHTHDDTRNKNNPHVNIRRTNIAAKTIRHNGPQIWNNISDDIKQRKTTKSFMHAMKTNIIYGYSQCS